MDRTTYEVYTTTHPDDVTECREIFAAYAAMTRLVEDGFTPVCERHGFSGHVRIMSWSDILDAMRE